MADAQKYDRILDALEQLIVDDSIQNISVSEIAAKAGIGKGSIYYYFPSKEAILDALIRRNYETPVQTAKTLANQTDIPPFTRMAMLFQACRSSSAAFLKQGGEKSRNITVQEAAYLHQKYLNYLVSELKPELAEIIRQGIESGEIHFEYPEALAEIALIVLGVKLNNTFLSATPEDCEYTIQGLVSLLEHGTGVPEGTLSYISIG
ncbi:MAG: TetR/AcrR family transcriptional regulator [Bacteroidales bacterium]|nr:TetR/AcrR family transcriptional regulator [Bacteroidales bacterium]MCM1415336.1 TetR/AcrR family transcriptional regulator [bacterium]MCM1424023.1 TetR/AcrR family transcriptional regulator [bacterium]